MKLKFSNTPVICFYNYTYHFIRLAARSLWLAAFFLSGCENDQKVVREMTEKKIMTEEAKNIESFLSQDGIMKAKLTSPHMLRVMGDTLFIEFPKSLHIDFFDAATVIESWVDAKYGKYYENYNKAYLKDSVVVINYLGDTLKCPDLWWDQEKKMFYTDKYAEYHTRDKHIYGGKGMEASQDLKSIIFKQPTGTVLVTDKGFPE